MPVWIRSLLAGLAGLAVALLPNAVGDALGAYAPVPAALAVAVAGALLGILGGVVAALIAAAAVLGPATSTGLEGVRVLVEGGALLGPAAYLAVGVATGSHRSLLRRLSGYRAASDRAQYDVLTGLLNRSAFEQRLNGWLASGADAAAPFAVLFVDLDRF
jgi:hypothetical protein